MVWFKVDDSLAGHAKARRAGLEAMGLWALAGAHCSQQLTDGHVPVWYVDSWPKGQRLAQLLVDAGLWHAPGVTCEDCPTRADGWQFHGWAERNPLRAEVEAERAAAKERMRARRAARADARSTGRSPEHPTVVRANERRTPPDPVRVPRPVPTRPDRTSYGSTDRPTTARARSTTDQRVQAALDAGRDVQAMADADPSPRALNGRTP